MGKTLKSSQLFNLIIPMVVLLLLTGYIIFAGFIFRSILENRRVVHDLQVAYYRLEFTRNASAEEAGEKEYASLVSKRRVDFVAGMDRLWSRPFFKEMKKFDPGLAALMQKLRLASSTYTSDGYEKFPLEIRREIKKKLEKNLEEMYVFINEYGDKQMYTLRMANFFVTVVFVFYTIILFSLVMRNRYAEMTEQRVRSMGRVYIRKLEYTKKNIAYDIHDTVIQELGSARLQLCKVLEERAPREDLVGEALNGIETSIDTLRNIINGLQQWNVRVYSLKQALGHLIDEMARAASFSITLKTGGLQKIRLPEDYKAQILAIVHEALTNVKKHAEATEAVVSVVVAGSRVEIRVRDDGKGFSVDLPNSVSSIGRGDHIGLVSMEERARLMGGEVSIRSKPKRGTVVRLTVPLDEKREDEDTLL